MSWKRIKSIKFDYDATEMFADDIRLLLKKDAQDGALTFKISNDKTLLNYDVYLNQYPLAVVQFNIPATEITPENLRHKFDKAIRENYHDLGMFLALQWLFNDDERAECGIVDLVEATNSLLKNHFALQDLQANIKRRCLALNFYEVYDYAGYIGVSFKTDGFIDKEIKVDKETYNTKIKGEFNQLEFEELSEIQNAVMGFIKNHC